VQSLLKLKFRYKIHLIVIKSFKKDLRLLLD
jgi:hypothetical protein